jgi:hypothetical protein
LQIIKDNGTATEFMKGLQSSIDKLAGVVLKEAKQGRVYGLVPSGENNEIPVKKVAQRKGK